jgi:hypothetical protein
MQCIFCCHEFKLYNIVGTSGVCVFYSSKLFEHLALPSVRCTQYIPQADQKGLYQLIHIFLLLLYVTVGTKTAHRIVSNGCCI